jgi:hypothetical protein
LQRKSHRILKGRSCTHTKARNRKIKFAKISSKQIEIAGGGEFEK